MNTLLFIVVFCIISINFASCMPDIGIQDHGADVYNIPSIMTSAEHDNSIGGRDLPQVKPIIHKHIYVHVPPHSIEQDDDQPQIRSKLASPHKHYKIIFIKAPSPSIIPILQTVQNHEEKTLIYVLHKKPEVEDIATPTPAPTQPSKPEVYFIKYRNKKYETPPVYGPPPQNIIHEKGSKLNAIVPEDNTKYRSLM